MIRLSTIIDQMKESGTSGTAGDSYEEDNVNILQFDSSRLL